MKLLVGLGNPGVDYQATRHNAGFWWIDAVAQVLKVSLPFDRSYNAALVRTSVHGQALWLMQPQTFMNRSGQSVGALARFFKMAPQDILVAHDELDIPAGQLKLKFGGGHAGHNGLRDLHAALGSDQYWRLRIGIGHPGIKSEVVNWVLQKPPPAERTAIAQAIDHSTLALSWLLSGDIPAATKHIHSY